MPETIKSFTGEHAFLSNFHPSPITYEGITYPTLEHAFQATKTRDPVIRQAIADKKTPGQAKRAGGKQGIIRDFNFEEWENKKIFVMEHLCRLKFQNPTLEAQLAATGDATLEEGNSWNDTFWGVSLRTGKGRNELGRILMHIRLFI